jgi:hypothetical protein
MPIAKYVLRLMMVIVSMSCIPSVAVGSSNRVVTSSRPFKRQATTYWILHDTPQDTFESLAVLRVKPTALLFLISSSHSSYSILFVDIVD